MKPYAPVLVRIAMSLVFLWFGTNQLMHPDMWARLVPGWAAGMFIGGGYTVALMNGWFEAVLALTLLVGFQVRTVSLILAIHLLGIASTFGLSAVGARDFGLSLATLSIFLNGFDILSLDRKLIRDKVVA